VPEDSLHASSAPKENRDSLLNRATTESVANAVATAALDAVGRYLGRSTRCRT